jgi:hypothetical protein
MIFSRNKPQPAPLNFLPQGGALEVPSYGRVFKAIALLFLVLSTSWAIQIQMDATTQHAHTTVLWVWAPWALMACTVGFICVGTTRLTSTAVEQSWLWAKRIEFQQLAYAKVIRVPGLDWLIAPRFYTRSLGGKIVVFYAADATMLSEMKRLAQCLVALQQQS